MTADHMQASADTWASALYGTYGKRMFWPKTHKAFAHIADQLRMRAGHAIMRAFLPACWAQENSYSCAFRFRLIVNSIRSVANAIRHTNAVLVLHMYAIFLCWNDTTKSFGLALLIARLRRPWSEGLPRT